MITFKKFLEEEGEPTNAVGSGGVDNPEGKKLSKKPLKRKKKKEEDEEV